ncbi:MAG: RES family NAD+ phosphorylase [Bacteroidetes bacterium]|nr:RES family NAD+ phosphorylase [Bacteroidota bacterium]
MTLFRFAHRKFARDLSGTGARLKGGRWNPPGISVIYTSENISLALLEILANAHTLEDLQLVQLMEIEVPDNIACHDIRLQGLKKNWHHDFDYTQWMGKEVLQSQQNLLCRCPSAIVHQEHNYLINPLHPDFRKIKLGNSADFYFDERLFKQQAV